MSRSTNARLIQRAAGSLGCLVACLVLSARLSAQERNPRAIFQGHSDAVTSLSFSADGKTLASGSEDASIKFWDVATGKNAATLKEEDPYLWGSVAFSPDGKLFATGGWFNKVKLWEIGNRKGKILLDELKQCPETLVVFSPDGKTIASGGICRGEMKLFDAASGKTKSTLVTWDGGNPEGVLAMAFSQDGKSFASAGRPDEIKLWDVATGKNTSTSKTANKFRTAAFSLDGKTLAAAVWTESGGWYIAKDVKIYG